MVARAEAFKNDRLENEDITIKISKRQNSTKVSGGRAV
jgi:hypothetical protein